MKYFLLITCLFSLHVQAQKLYFTSSLGWGYGLFGSGNFSETNNLETSMVNYRAALSFSDFLADPQTGYVLEYRINNKHALSIGRMSGKSENSIAISMNNKNSYTYFGGVYRKLGITYTYTFKHINIHMGCYAANNRISNTKEGGTEFISVVKDDQGITRDSSFIGDFMVRPWGMTTSFGFGYMFYNKKKNRDRFAINLLLDIGWFDLNGVKNFNLYDYNRTFTSYSYSNGSQLKIYISKPILLYDFRKDKYHLF